MWHRKWQAETKHERVNVMVAPVTLWPDSVWKTWQIFSRILETTRSPVWKIWEEFETFLENKQISIMRKKHLGDQIVINSYVYMFFNCDQSWIKSYLLCYFWRPFPIILETKHNWKSSLGDQPPRFSSLARSTSWIRFWRSWRLRVN